MSKIDNRHRVIRLNLIYIGNNIEELENEIKSLDKLILETRNVDKVSGLAEILIDIDNYELIKELITSKFVITEGLEKIGEDNNIMILYINKCSNEIKSGIIRSIIKELRIAKLEFCHEITKSGNTRIIVTNGKMVPTFIKLRSWAKKSKEWNVKMIIPKSIKPEVKDQLVLGVSLKNNKVIDLFNVSKEIELAFVSLYENNDLWYILPVEIGKTNLLIEMLQNLGHRIYRGNKLLKRREIKVEEEDLFSKILEEEKQKRNLEGGFVRPKKVKKLTQEKVQKKLGDLMDTSPGE